MKVPKKEPEEGPTAAKQPRLGSEAAPPGDKKQETETVTVRKQCQFEKLKATLKVDLSNITPKQLKKISATYFIIRSLLEYCSKTGGDKPGLAHQDELKTQCEETLKNLQLDTSLLSDKFTLR